MGPNTDASQLAPLIEAKYQLIPLHRWDKQVRCPRTGKLRERGKSPMHGNWTKLVYRSEDQVGHMEAGQNVGVRLTAHDLVVDVDPRSLEGGRRAMLPMLRSLGVDHDAFPTVRTGGGGLHLYMVKPSKLGVVDGLRNVPGVEFKTLGRQVVAPGSLHPTGRPYTWSSMQDDLWLGAPRAPNELLVRIRRPKMVTKDAGAGAGEHPPEEIGAILDRLDPEDFRDHDRWLQLMMACHHASAGAASEEFVDWCGRDPLYAGDGTEVAYRWGSLHRHGVGLGTLYMFMREAGIAQMIDRRAHYDFPDDLCNAEVVP
jgi:hypothetical protein